MIECPKLTDEERYELLVYRFIDQTFKDDQLKYILLGLLSKANDYLLIEKDSSKESIQLKIKKLSKMRIILRQSLKMVNRSIHDGSKILMNGNDKNI